MKPAFIKAHLQVSGHPPSKLAEELGMKPSTVSQIINGKRSSLRIARRISAITGIPVSKLWPGRYDRRLRQAA